jgi:hypothetical protein
VLFDADAEVFVGCGSINPPIYILKVPEISGEKS